MMVQLYAARCYIMTGYHGLLSAIIGPLRTLAALIPGPNVFRLDERSLVVID